MTVNVQSGGLVSLKVSAASGAHSQSATLNEGDLVAVQQMLYCATYEADKRARFPFADGDILAHQDTAALFIVRDGRILGGRSETPTAYDTSGFYKVGRLDE